MNTLPRSAEALNAWIYSHFTVLERAGRAFIEFPIQITCNGEHLYTGNRVVFVALSLAGDEEDCCLEIANTLKNCVSLEKFQDAYELLLIRTNFSYDLNARHLKGRVAFYATTPQESLKKSRAFIAEGQVPRPALREGAR